LDIEYDLIPILRSARRMLEPDGHEITVVGSCAEARALSYEFDVGVINLVLANGLGVEVAEEMLHVGRGTPSSAVPVLCRSQIDPDETADASWGRSSAASGLVDCCGTITGRLLEEVDLDLAQHEVGTEYVR
jgi:hypothetical protein